MLRKVAVFVVKLTALVFLLFGAACLIGPTEVIHSATGHAITHNVALIDIRATYGGMSLGVAAILYFLSTSTALLRAGLFSVLALMLSMAGGRAAGMIAASTTNGVMLFYLALEIMTATVAAVLLYKGARAGEY